jgi:lysophospholipase L1-like esterase
MLRSAIAFLCFVLFALAPAGARADGWVGSWGSSTAMPGPRFAFDDYTVAVQGTVRWRLKLSVGGRQVQLRLSNEEGTAPLRVESVTIGLAADGVSVQPGTMRQVTFGGARAVTMEPGASALGDPVELTVPALGHVIVSLAVPGGTVVARNGVLQAAKLVTARDVTGALDLPGDAADTKARPIVTGIAVAGGGAKRTIVALGDSISDGIGSGSPATRGWPTLLAKRLAPAKIGVVNHGIAANRLLRDDFAKAGLVRLERDALTTPRVTHVILLEGTNDLQHSGREVDGVMLPLVTAADLIAGYEQAIQRAHQRGVRIIGGTLIPWGGSRNFSEARELTRTVVNEWIRTSGAYDGVIDFDRAMRDPAAPQKIRAAFDSGDHLHPNDAGFAAMAAAIDVRLLGVKRSGRKPH